MPSSLRSALHRRAAEALAAAGVPVERVAGRLIAAPQALDGWVVLVADALDVLGAPQIAVDLPWKERHTRPRCHGALHEHLRAVKDLDISAGEMHHYSKYMLAGAGSRGRTEGKPERALRLMFGRRRHDLPPVAPAVSTSKAGELSQHPVSPAAGAGAGERRGSAGRQGRMCAARAAYSDALDIYIGLEAAWDIRRADSRLRSLGLHRGACGPSRRPPTGWEALTPSELTIAGLVAAGRSKPEIAAELFLSRRIVQTHVSHILAKLGGQSRMDVARAAIDKQSAAS
jgi:DNA-binding CsgD family transcriptional regulator